MITYCQLFNPFLGEQSRRRLISDQAFNTFLGQAIDMVAETIAGGDSTAMPTIVLAVCQAPTTASSGPGRGSDDLRGDGGGLAFTKTLIVLDMRLDERKNERLYRTGEALVDHLPMLVAVYLIGEAWEVTVSPGEPGPPVSLQHHPDRQEVIALSGLTLDGRTNGARFAVRRNERGGMELHDLKIIALGDEQVVSSSQMLRAFLLGYAEKMVGARDSQIGLN
jgi:hypothetical protein